ncbi:PIG-L family deacetylase [Micromonospora sp. KC606]|uniref:PIG-L deacetylase family protein n=1 Tax=Micromonospora sp. KC606 TaxID=2530379 RepID=UPI00104A4044|nr:PIG-L family deacetylase [Micromonospora sp. KC606]TDC72382.1 PIG-L family deacetylase [Micromonospora sp. KC606]
MDRLLIVVAHGDDETLGAGGTITLLTDAGVEVSLCVLTNDDSARAWDGHVVTDRTSQIQAAASILGIKRVQVNTFGDSRLDQVGQLELNRVVEREIREFEPDALFTTSMAELSVDHQLASRAARVAGRPGRSGIREIRCFEVRSATDCAEASGVVPTFRPNCWQVLDESHLERKLEALRAYGKEIEKWPSARSEDGVRALGAYRGSQVSAPLAEAFELVRLVR